VRSFFRCEGVLITGGNLLNTTPTRGNSRGKVKARCSTVKSGTYLLLSPGSVFSILASFSDSPFLHSGKKESHQLKADTALAKHSRRD
jgi:hypothetical protein